MVRCIWDLSLSEEKLHGFNLLKIFLIQQEQDCLQLGLIKHLKIIQWHRYRSCIAIILLDTRRFQFFVFRKFVDKDLAFSRIFAFGQFTYPVTPLFNVTVSGMWFPDLNGYFAGPSFDYSLAENIDFSLFWQHFNSNINEERTRINIAFLRIEIQFLDFSYFCLITKKIKDGFGT